MDKVYKPILFEIPIYQFWESKGFLEPSEGKPFTILMPPPNANDPLHAGHGMYVIDDILIRFKRLQGYASLWIPGTDHAGFETQYVYEKYLQKEGKSRFDYDRETLYKNIYDYVIKNSSIIINQLKRLGFLAAWSRKVFMLDKEVIQKAYSMFLKMFNDGLIYRDSYIVNYCTHCGTSLAELEVKYIERKDPLYYLKYGPLTVATVRPETKFGDTALAVNPNDFRYKKWIGKEIEVDGLLKKFNLKVIADEFVDKEFGTGVVKITPAHDPKDFVIGKKHGLEVKSVITLEGRMSDNTGKYAGMTVDEARKVVVEDLKAKGLLEKIDYSYVHSVSTCYKCGCDIEPMIIPNWFIRTESLKNRALQVIKEDKVLFFPKKYKKQIIDWFEVMHDWPISRQIAWGIRIPVWYDAKKFGGKIFVVWVDDKKIQHQGIVADFIKEGVNFETIEKGLQKMIVPADSDINFVISEKKPGNGYLPETDTFDTWFSSSMWPLVTLYEKEYKTRFPTDFMGTLSDILKFWISRMIMFSLYERNEIPFRHVYLWPMVADKKGVKMSKSKGNVINPIEMVEKYGADAFRTSLIFGIGEGGKVILAEEKVVAMRNFMNKVWNIGRLIYLVKTATRKNNCGFNNKNVEKTVESLFDESKKVFKKVKSDIEKYAFSRAFNALYNFLWHRFADYYIEVLKNELREGNTKVQEAVEKIYLQTLVLLHPFAPFVTEAIWKVFFGQSSSILDGGKKFFKINRS